MTEKKQATNPDTDTDCPNGNQQCRKGPVTVTLALSQPVACPGHPLEITATGSPSGGTYAWTKTSGDAQLVDASGAATTSGATIYLRSFKPDDATGNIPEQTVKVKVVYSHPDGTAEAEEEVKIHQITFTIANEAIVAGNTIAMESAAALRVGHNTTPTINSTPDVTINLDASCPRKTDCAQAHTWGFLQIVITNNRSTRYTHTEITNTVDYLPMRDQVPGSAFPWYIHSVTFTGDGDTQSLNFQDTPMRGASWTDPRPAAPAPPPAQNRQLRRLTLENSFHTWLVVRNDEWWAHPAQADKERSFAFQRNFAWSCGGTFTVDTTQPVGSRASPATHAATAPATPSAGKGGVNPVIRPEAPNTNHTNTAAASPALP